MHQTSVVFCFEGTIFLENKQFWNFLSYSGMYIGVPSQRAAWVGSRLRVIMSWHMGHWPFSDGKIGETGRRIGELLAEFPRFNPECLVIPKWAFNSASSSSEFWLWTLGSGVNMCPSICKKMCVNSLRLEQMAGF